MTKQASEQVTVNTNVAEAQAQVHGDVLVLVVPLADLGPSSSGKTDLVASLNGNRQVAFTWNGRLCRAGVTAFTKRPKA